VPVGLGVLAGATRRFVDPDHAVGVLNRYALLFAFPALVFHSLLSSTEGLPRSPGFWLLVPAVWLSCVGLGRWLRPAVAGPLALGLGFGNVAYLGLPVVGSVLGADALSRASVAVSVHLVLGLSVGPALLLRWGETDRVASPAQVLRQPLFWAPFLGFAGRLLPAPALELCAALALPLARSAAPVALFLLGLYLHTHRARLRRLDGADLGIVAAKVVLLPVLTLGAAWALVDAGWLRPADAQIFVLLAAMPAAIATFSLARELGTGQDRMGRAVVASTIASMATIPLFAWLARGWMTRW